MPGPWKDARGIIVTTTPTIEGRPIQDYLGIVTGEVIVGANLFRDADHSAVVDAVRTAGGKRGGKLAGVHPVDLGAAVFDAIGTALVKVQGELLALRNRIADLDAEIAALEKAAPGIRLVTATVDDGLNEIAYIVPGLGDAGDRQFGPR